MFTNPATAVYVFGEASHEDGFATMLSGYRGKAAPQDALGNMLILSLKFLPEGYFPTWLSYFWNESVVLDSRN